MERLHLTDDLVTGIYEIDNQHRELFARGNAVLFPEAGNASVEDVIDALAFLIHYVDEHFAAEERLMKHYEYDRLQAHRNQHERLRRDVEGLYNRTSKAGTLKGLENELYYLFTDWYIYHIKEWDHAYAGFLQKQVKLETIKIPALDDVDDSEVEILIVEEGRIPPAELKIRKKSDS